MKGKKANFFLTASSVVRLAAAVLYDVYTQIVRLV